MSTPRLFYFYFTSLDSFLGVFFPFFQTFFLAFSANRLASLLLLILSSVHDVHTYAHKLAPEIQKNAQRKHADTHAYTHTNKHTRTAFPKPDPVSALSVLSPNRSALPWRPNGVLSHGSADAPLLSAELPAHVLQVLDRKSVV